MYEIRAHPGTPIPIGRRGENLARAILFDISHWVGKYGEGTVSLLHQRPGDSSPYPCAIVTDGSEARWEVTSADTAAAGDGKAELQYTVGDSVVKSCVYQTFIPDSLGDGSDPPPDPAKPWVDQVLQAGADAKEAADEADSAAERAEEAARRAEAATGTMQIGDGLRWNGNILEVDTATKVERDNTKPVTSAAVYTEIGNIEVLLSLI